MASLDTEKGLIDELKGRICSLDPPMKKVDLVGTCVDRIKGIPYEMEEKTDIDILALYEISRKEFKKKTNLPRDSDIVEMKEFVDRELGPIGDCKVDSYLVFGDNEKKYEEKLKENEESILIYDSEEKEQ